MLQNKTQVETVNFRLYFKVIIRQNDDFEIKSKIYSFNLRLVLKPILHSQDVFFRNLLFTLHKPVFGILNRLDIDKKEHRRLVTNCTEKG